MNRISFKILLLPFLLLAFLVTALQYFILQPHLRYGFADVDWKLILSFKEHSLSYPNPIEHISKAWKWGIYAYQFYYIGLIENFFGIDYKNFQIITHVFKLISVLSIFPVILLTTRNKLAASLATLIYTVSYSAVGVMYTVSTSGLFVAIPLMSLFFVWYWRLINKKKNYVWEILIAVVLLFLVLLLATDRMYPLVPAVLLIEIFWWFKNNYSKKVLLEIVKRLTTFAVVFLMIFLFNRSDFAGFFGGNTRDTYNRLVLGNWQVLMSPVISFGSLFLPRDYWKILGIPNINSLFSFMTFFISGPFVIFTFVTSFLALFLSKKKRKFILITLISVSFFSVLIYILSSHQLYIPDVGKMHFDINTVLPALLGTFVISLNIALFKEWLDTGRKDSLIISMVGGTVISLVFIILTWAATDYILIFTGVHRYLTIPAIGSSLFIAGLITIIFNKLLKSKFTKQLAFMVLLLLIPIISFNSKVIADYFTYELNYAGMDANEHTRMKNKLWSFLTNFSKTEPSIFYFDESTDHDNGYFDETTVLAGFNFWMRFRGREIVSSNLTPALLRSNLICPEPRDMCLDKVKSLVVTQNGEKGFLYGTIFYKLENFYAFRFINKDIVDIKPEVLKLIGLE